LLKRLMARFADSEGPEPHYIVGALLNVRGPTADATLIAWFKRHKRVQTQIAVGLVGRDSVPRDSLRKLVARGDAYTQLAAKSFLEDNDTEAKAIAFLKGEDLESRVQAAEMAGLRGLTGATEHLMPLVTFLDANYYPNDALVRHTAMTALVRLALFKTRPAPKPTEAEAGAPATPEAPPPPAAATPAAGVIPAPPPTPAAPATP
jgi:hypothetical protein